MEKADQKIKKNKTDKKKTGNFSIPKWETSQAMNENELVAP